VRDGAAEGADRSALVKLAGQRALQALIRRLPGQHRRTAHLTRCQVPAGMREAGTCPGPSPPGRYPAGSASRTHDHVERCLPCLRQRLRVRPRVRYWLRLRFRFRRRQWPRLRPGFQRRRRHWRGHRWRHWRRLHRLGPRRLRLRGFRLRCLTSIRSRVWHHLAGHFAVGHRGLTGTICGHPEMIPSRPSAHHSAADLSRRPVRLPAHALRAGPGRSIARRQTGTLAS
jgi:hypothetical protein